MVTGILLAVTTGICWIWAGIVTSHASRRNMSIPFIQLFGAVFGFGISCVILAGMALLFPERFGISRNVLLLSAGSQYVFGILNYLMFIAMGRAMREGPNGIVWSIVQSGLIFPFLMGITIFSVPAGPVRWIGLFLILGALVFFGIGKGTAKKKTDGKAVGKWYLFALLAMLLCGMNQCFGNLPSYLSGKETVSPVFRAMFSQMGALTGWGIGMLMKWTDLKTGFEPGKRKMVMLFALAGNAVGLLSTYLFFYNAQDYLVRANAGAIAYPVIVCSCVAGFFLYSIFVLREKTHTAQKIGFVLGLAGIIAICMQ